MIVFINCNLVEESHQQHGNKQFLHANRLNTRPAYSAKNKSIPSLKSALEEKFNLAFEKGELFIIFFFYIYEIFNI